MHDHVTFFMRAALRKAQEGLGNGELPIGAVVVLNNQIIAAAHTSERAEGRLLVHAELLALEAADKLKPFPGKRRDVQLFTTSEPCMMCLGAAMSFCVGEVYYGHEVPSDGAVGLIYQWQRAEADFPSYRVPQIVGGVLRDEAIALFKAYVARHSSGGMWEWARTIARL
jgi:tRNA(adenine34) deaminase